ncbi:MAG: hypothetical protein EOL87_00180 [Spartobacteria bacterium]|nr:hypothetical protein [Spartobacteria bacterium]
MKNRMMKMMAALAVGVMMMTVAATYAAEKTTCPVMGGAINRSLGADAEGPRVYGCCRGCADEVRKNPQKCLDQWGAGGQSTEKQEAASCRCGRPAACGAAAACPKEKCAPRSCGAEKSCE